MQHQEVDSTLKENYIHSEIQRLTALGYPFVEITNQLGIRYSRVASIARALGIPRYKRNILYSLIGNGTMSANDIYDDYTKNTLSTHELARKADCTTKTITKILRCYGISPKEQRVGRKYRTVTNKLRSRNAIKKPCVDRSIKIKKWRLSYGRLLEPVYEDILKGATILGACAKHKVDPQFARKHFKRMQNRYAAYLDFGQPIILKLIVSRERLKQFEWVAKQSHNNVLDWALHNLKAICDSKDYYNGRKSNSSNRADTSTQGTEQQSAE
jgi:hypothetical protein